MKLQANTVLHGGIAFFVGLALFFWTAASLTHMNCCSQEWVDRAPDAATRDVRAQARTRSITETAELKREDQIYSISSLVGVMGVVILYRRMRKKRQTS
jgi:hypothetical protein